MKCKQDEKALQESEEQYKAIFDNSLDGVFLTIPDGTILAANPAACQMFGMTEEELVQAGRNGTVDTSDPRLKYVLETRAKTGRFKGELNHRRKDGTIFPSEISSALFKDKGGLVKGVIIIRDITARKQAEDALRKNEAQYRMLFTNMTEGFGLVEVIYNNYGRPYDYRYLEVNPAFELYLGVKREELLGKTMRETFPKLSPIAIEKYNEVALSGQPINFEIFSHVANKYLDIRAFIPEKGKVALILRDISERTLMEDSLKKAYDNLEELIKGRTLELEEAYTSLKESEKGLAEAQKLAHIGNWEWDVATNKAYWSDELYHIFGRDHQELAPTYDEYLDYVHPDDREYADNAHKEALNGKSFSIDHRIVLSNGEERTIHMKTEVIFSEKNIPIKLKGTVQDITERKRAEEKIRILANIVESSNDAIGTVSLDGIIESWNQGAEKVYGYSTEEILGKPVSILAPPHLDKETIKLIDEIKNGKSIQNYETLRLRKDGVTINVSLTLSPVFDTSGKLTAVSFITRDITEKKEVDEKLRESEEKYRNIVETANEGIGIIDSRGIVTFANKKLWDMVGYSVEESYNKSAYDLIEDSTAFKSKLEERLKGASDNYELKAMRKDGSKLWVLASVKSLFNEKDVYTGSLGMFTDITKLKEAEKKLIESEEKYRTIVETANEGIGIIDNELKLTYVNKKIEEMIGYSSEEIIGKKLWDFLGKESKPIVKSILERGLQDIENPELKYIRKDGSLLWAQVNAKPIFDSDGKFKGIITMLSDITKRKETEEVLKNIEIARKKEIHHRIKNNLQVISSLLDLQAEQFRNREDIRDSEVLEAFQESQDRVISMALIHEELYKGGGFETLNFSPYVQELAGTLFQTYRLGNADISLNIDIEENLSFDMDTAVPLGMIVNELVSNSLKHAFIGRDKGEVRIKLHRDESTEFESESSGSTSTATGFTLIVSDNGVGVSENLDIENLESLGMQLVTSLVDQLDGELQLKRDNGTKFTVRFRIKEKNE